MKRAIRGHTGRPGKKARRFTIKRQMRALDERVWDWVMSEDVWTQEPLGGAKHVTHMIIAPATEEP